MLGKGAGPPGLPALTRAVSEAVLAGTLDPVDDECRRLVILVRERCPGLVPTAPLTAGQVGPEIPLDAKAGAVLYRLVAREVAGLPTEQSSQDATVVWAQGDDELAVLVDRVSVTTAQGAVAVDVPVRCDQVGETSVRVRFALGSDARPAGVVAATDQRPFGPPAVVDVWGEAATVFAWQIVLGTAARIADATGRDVDGAGLIPVALRATDAGIAVLTMARHPFDRRASA
jgi:hypothetical protein